MARPSRKLRVCRWVGLGLCLVLICLWLASFAYAFTYASIKSPTPTSLPVVATTATGPASTPPVSVWCWTADLYILYSGVFSAQFGAWHSRAVGGLAVFGPFRAPPARNSFNYGVQGPSFGPGMILIPLWLPLALVAIPTLWLWCGHWVARRRRTIGWLQREWPTQRQAFLLSVGVGGICLLFVVPCLLIGVFWLISMVVSGGYSDDIFPRERTGETLVLLAFLLVWLVASYLLARWAYSRLRWRRILDRFPYCNECRYDLTGNVSGICPECGVTLIEEQKKRLAGVGGTAPRPEGG